MTLLRTWASLVAELVKNLPAMWETWVWSLGWEDPLEKEKAIPTPVFWPGEFPGLYNSWGLKELDTTEWFSLHHVTQEFLSRCLLKRIENVCPCKNLYMSIHRRIICNSLKLATTQMSINWLVDKHNIICPYKWYYSAITKNVASPGSSDGKESACNAGEPGSIPG